jgi:DNA polymerase zeta
MVKGIPFYGFHVGYRYYLKIYMLNPLHMTRLADLLRQGVVMKRVFQPYEAHLQYLLQWMADYNLYGCGYIDCSKVTFRSPLPDHEELTNPAHLWHDRSVPIDAVTPDSELPRVSHCSIEVDICCQDIVNRQDVKPRHLHEDFIERLNPLAPDEKLVHSMAGLWKDETRRRKSKMSNPAPGSSPFPAEVMVSMSADPRNSQAGGWIHEEEYREMISNLIKDEKDKSDGLKISFNTFVKSTPFSSSVKTSLESVEDLYPENLRPVLGLTQSSDTMNVNYDIDDNNEREVDERRILAFNANDDDEDFPYDSDEDIMREIELSQRKKGDKVEEKHLESDDMQRPEHGIDDESRPGGEDFAEQFVDQQDPDSLKGAGKSVNIGISDELQTHYNNASNPNDSKRTLPPGHDQPVSKRVKLSPHKSDEQSLSFQEREQIDNLSNSEEDGENISALLQQLKGVRSKNRISKRHLPTVNGVATKGASLSFRLSQEAPKSSQQAHALALTYPVVKDPHDTNTTLRLSQKSGSSPGLSGRQKHVSFDPLLSSPQTTDSQSKQLASTLPTGLTGDPTQVARSRKLRACFEGSGSKRLFCVPELPPARDLVVSTMHHFGLPSMIYQDAYYSNEEDAPERTREWAGREFKLESLTVPFLPEFDPTATSDATFGMKNINFVVENVDCEAGLSLNRRLHS